MKEYKSRERTIREEKLSKVICDFCKEELEKTLVIYEGYGKIEIEFGYGSEYDEDSYTGEICDGCFKEIFKDKLKRSRALYL